jgi:hypothetical protein
MVPVFLVDRSKGYNHPDSSIEAWAAPLAQRKMTSKLWTCMKTHDVECYQSMMVIMNEALGECDSLAEDWGSE